MSDGQKPTRQVDWKATAIKAAVAACAYLLIPTLPLPINSGGLFSVFGIAALLIGGALGFYQFERKGRSHCRIWWKVSGRCISLMSLGFVLSHVVYWYMLNQIATPSPPQVFIEVLWYLVASMTLSYFVIVAVCILQLGVLRLISWST